MRRWVIAIGLVACVGSALWVWGHAFYTTKITWSRDVSRIVYRHCVSCHHPGDAFSLLTYKEARPWAESIKHQVLERRMPPWNAVKGFGDFEDDMGLSQEDIEIIGEWVEGGCPEGNPAYMPPVPEFPPPPSGRSMVEQSLIIPTFGATTTIRHTVKVVGIGAVHVPESGELQAVAIEPNGTLVPLLWFKDFHPNWQRVYYFREPLLLRAGTRIQVTPRTGRVLLHTGKPSF